MRSKILSNFLKIVLFVSFWGFISNSVYAKNRGLYNSGSDCFLSACLQVLTQTKPLMSFLGEYCTHQMRSDYKILGKRSSPLLEFYELSQAMKDGGPEDWYKNVQTTTAANAFRKSIIRHEPFNWIGVNGQRDTLQFYADFLNYLEENHFPTDTAWGQIFKYSQLDLRKCTLCNFEREIWNILKYQTVSVPSVPECTLSDCMTVFRGTEQTLDGVNCEKCGMPTDQTTRTYLGKNKFCSRVFVLALARFGDFALNALSDESREQLLSVAIRDQWVHFPEALMMIDNQGNPIKKITNARLTKNHEGNYEAEVKYDAAVTIPLELDISRFLYKPKPLPRHLDGPILYDLYGIIIHSGFSARSGHYWAIVKDEYNNWYRYNDSAVTLLSTDDVKDICNSGRDEQGIPYEPGIPYALFYERSWQELATPMKIDDLKASLQVLRGKLGELSGRLVQLKNKSGSLPKRR